MVRLVAGLVCLLFVAACQQTGANKSSPSADKSYAADSTAESGSEPAAEPVDQDVSSNTSETTAEAVQTDVAETQEAALTVEPLVYEESFTFDWDMSQKLRQGDGEEVVLLTPEGVTLTEIPEQLDRWLSRVRESGGYVKAAPAPKEGEERSRVLLGALFDVLLYLLGIVKEEVTFSPADDYNAILFFEEDTGEVERIIFYPKS